jgi:hypothetical protein
MPRRRIAPPAALLLPAVIAPPAPHEIVGTHPLEIEEGHVIIASNCHYLPGEPASTAHRALVALTSRFAEEGSLRAVVMNGDVADFPKVSKHARIGWEGQPAVADELAIVQHRMGEIAEIAGLDTELVMTIGNHDVRLDTFLSQNAAACEGVKGFALRDHIEPCWAMAWQVEINGSDPTSVLVKHRHRSGASATKANVLAAGRSIVTSHTHQPGITRISHGSRHLYGVDTGCVAALNSHAFVGYTEMAAAAGMSNWASAFAVLTFEDGLLLPPEHVLVLDEDAGLWSWRGRVHRAGTIHSPSTRASTPTVARWVCCQPSSSGPSSQMPLPRTRRSGTSKDTAARADAALPRSIPALRPYPPRPTSYLGSCANVARALQAEPFSAAPVAPCPGARRRQPGRTRPRG